jgi:hypothetical protein
MRSRMRNYSSNQPSYHIKVPEDDMKYGLLWLLGVPVAISIIGYLLFH